MAAVTWKVNSPPLQESEPKEEAFRPSSHVSICLDETTGILWLWADETIALAPSLSAESVACSP